MSGGRRWQSGVNVLGALRETTDSALAWQLRGFAAEEGAVGSNFGLIYRQLAGEKNLLGVNTFVDYEDHDYGEFWRWSFGGELRGAWGGLFFNQYWAITGKQRFEDGGYYYDAYTRDGRDVALDLRMPYYDWLSGGLTYYHWRGEEGELDNGGTYKMADEKGIRYHFGFDFSRLFGGGDFWGGLEILAEYDRPEGDDADWGVDLSYTHRFGEATGTGSSATTEGFDPRAHFFDPVRREYAQRIDRVTVGTVTVTVEPGRDVRVTAVAGSGSVEGVTMGTLTVGGPEVMYRSSETVTIVSNPISGSMPSVQLSAERPGFWMLDILADTELSFAEAGSRLSLSRGSVWISRSGGIVSANSDSVMVDFSGVASMTLGYRGSRTYVNLGHGEVAVTMAGVQDSLFSLTISGESRAVVASQGRTITVTPIRGGTVTITQRATMVGDFYTLSYEETGGVRGGGLIFSVAPATGWTVSDSGVVGPTSDDRFMEAVVVEVSDPYSKTQSWMIGHPTLSLTSPVRSDFPLLTSAAGDMPLLTLAALSMAVGGGLPPYQLGTPTTEDGITLSAGVLRLSSPGVLGERRAATIRVTDGTAYNMLDFVLNVRFVPPFGFRNAATVLAVAEDYSGVVQTLTAAAIGGTATATYSTATPDVSIGGSDGVLSLATPLAGNDKGVTVMATDGNLTVSHVLTLRSVSPLVLSLPPTLYVALNEPAGFRNEQLTVTGGDGGGATVFESFNSDNGGYGISDSGLIIVIPSLIQGSDRFGGTEFSSTVSVSQPAVIGGRTTADILNILIYDSLSVADLPTLTAEIGRTGAVAGGVVMPAGGSGVYGFSVVVGGATVTVGTDGVLGLSMAVTTTTTLSVVVAVTDSILTALAAVSVTAVLESRFVDRLSLAAFETRYYVLEAGEGRPFSSSPLVTLTVEGGVSGGGYEWGEGAGTDAQGLLSVRSTTGVATVQVTARAGSIVTVAYTITVGRDEAVGLTTALTVVFYQGRLAFSNPRVAVRVSTGMTGGRAYGDDGGRDG